MKNHSPTPPTDTPTPTPPTPPFQPDHLIIDARGDFIGDHWGKIILTIMLAPTWLTLLITALTQ